MNLDGVAQEKESHQSCNSHFHMFAVGQLHYGFILVI